MNTDELICAMDAVIKHLEENVAAFTELCGEHDEVNTVPAKVMLEKARAISGYLLAEE